MDTAIYNEGFGTLYERMVRKEYLKSIRDRYSPLYTLEVKCGFGVDSLIFENPILVENRPEYLAGCRDVCTNAQIIDADFMKLPFRSNSFDLVWSSCLLDDVPSKQVFLDYLSELKRVCRRHLLLFVSNDLHPTHGILKISTGKPWIDIRTLPALIQKSRLSIIEKGNIDSPPWLSGICLPSHSKSDSRNLDSPILKKWVNIEKNYLPAILKVFMGHQVFVLSEKK